MLRPGPGDRRTPGDRLGRAIVASSTLATALARKATGRVDGFVLEGPTAGGYNAPPRGPLRCNERGEPLYGPRDVPDLDAFRKLERPFWLAGGYGSSTRLAEARAAGAAGVQVGTPFAFCEESGLTPSIKRRVLASARGQPIDAITDPRVSPTGFPFKVLPLAGSLSDAALYADRPRGCDLGYLRQAYKCPDGTLGWRCPAESVEAYVRKGGPADDTCGRKCLCNALLANVGLGQVHPDRGPELPLVTAGDDVRNLARFLPSPAAESYSASDVIRYQRLKRLGALPIILDESAVSLAELDEYVKLGLCDGVAIKPARRGGLIEARRQVEFLLDRRLLFLGSGLTDPDLALAASLLLYGAYDLEYPAALNGPQFLNTSLLKTPLAPVDGQLSLPEGAGLGVEVDEDRLRCLETPIGG